MVYEKRFKLVSAQNGCELPSFEDETRMCRIKIREDIGSELPPIRVQVKTEGEEVSAFVWRTPWSVYNNNRKSWVPVLDFDERLFPGMFLYTAENETSDIYAARRTRQQSLRFKMLDMIHRAPEPILVALCPIPVFVAELIKKEKVSKNEDCPISMTAFKECSSTTLTCCYHLFETSSIEAWLKKNKLCPVCKAEVKSKMRV
jgi:hypothetical protein